MLQVRLYRYRVALRFAISWGGRAHSVREGALVRLTDNDGREGWGEIAPLPGFSAESLTSALASAKQIGSQLNTHEHLRGVLRHPDLACSVRSGLAQAAWQLQSSNSWSAGTAVRLQALLTGSHEQILSQARQYASEDVSVVKVKVGQGAVSDDIRLVRKVSALLPEARLRLDANRSWQPDQARRFIDGVYDSNIDYLEEPLPPGADWRRLMQQSPLPIALDETLRETGTDERVSAARVYVIKPALMGGLTVAESFIRTAVGTNKRCIISSSWESGIGMYTLLKLASGLPTEAHGLDTYRLLAGDVLRHKLPLTPPETCLPARLPSIDDIDWQFVTPA